MSSRRNGNCSPRLDTEAHSVLHLRSSSPLSQGRKVNGERYHSAPTSQWGLRPRSAMQKQDGTTQCDAIFIYCPRGVPQFLSSSVCFPLRSPLFSGGTGDGLAQDVFRDSLLCLRAVAQDPSSPCCRCVTRNYTQASANSFNIIASFARQRYNSTKTATIIIYRMSTTENHLTSRKIITQIIRCRKFSLT